MAPRGADGPYSRMNSADTCSTDESVIVEDDEPCPAETSQSSCCEGHRRRGLLALLLIGLALAALCGWNAIRNPSRQITTGHSGAGDLEEKDKASKAERKELTDLATAEADVLVGLVSLPSDGSKPIDLQTPSLRGTSKAEAGAADGNGHAAPSDGVPMQGGKGASLAESDMPGAGAAAPKEPSSAHTEAIGPEMPLTPSNMPRREGNFTTPESVQHSTTVPAAVEFAKMQSLSESDVPGAEGESTVTTLMHSEEPEDDKQVSLQESNMPGAGTGATSFGSKAKALEESNFLGAKDSKQLSIESSSAWRVQGSSSVHNSYTAV